LFLLFFTIYNELNLFFNCNNNITLAIIIAIDASAAIAASVVSIVIAIDASVAIAAILVSIVIAVIIAVIIIAVIIAVIVIAVIVIAIIIVLIGFIPMLNISSPFFKTFYFFSVLGFNCFYNNINHKTN